MSGRLVCHLAYWGRAGKCSIFSLGLICGTDLCSTDRPGNGLVKHLDPKGRSAVSRMKSVGTSNQIVDLLNARIRLVRLSVIVSRMLLPSGSIFSLGLICCVGPSARSQRQKLFQTFAEMGFFEISITQILNQFCGVCRCQGIDGLHPKGRSAVQQNEIVSPATRNILRLPSSTCLSIFSRFMQLTKG